MTPYKPTLFDRHGPDAATYLFALGFGILVFGVTTGAIIMQAGFVWWALPTGLGFGAVAGSSGWLFGQTFGNGWKAVAVDGSSTPYERQFSYEQSLVMKGRVDDAIASFEAVIATEPELIAPRIKAAELYAREKKDAQRAAELFRDLLRSPTITGGENVYVTNRLVDLYIGPLNDPGRALVELRRLIETRPGTAAAEHARRSLADLKARMNVDSVEES
jgi:lipopolysaccharide biosynthesis regulator YciM